MKTIFPKTGMTYYKGKMVARQTLNREPTTMPDKWKKLNIKTQSH